MLTYRNIKLICSYIINLIIKNMSEILKKYSSKPKVFVLETENNYKKEDVVNYETKYGKEIELIIYKLVLSRNGKNYYSYLRADGKNRKTILENKIEKRKDWAKSQELKSDQYYETSKEGKDFLALAEPIKVGHHSENRHRSLIERNAKRMDKCIEHDKKAEEHKWKASNIENQLQIELPIDTPDCLEEIEKALQNATNLHKFYKENPDKREHSYSLTYAKKKVNDLTNRLKIANDLWRIKNDK